MRTNPSANPVFFVEVYQFHKIHQKPNARFENQQRYSILWNEGPLGTEVPRNVSREPRHNVQDHIAIRAGKKGIDRESRTTTLWDVRNLDRQPPDMALDPRGKKCGRVLFEFRDADDFAQHVVTVELDQRIPIYDQRNDSGQHHHEVRTFVDDGARFAKPPDGRGDGTKHQLRPDARERDHQPLGTSAHHGTFGG